VNQLNTRAIILSRTYYGEADRILTMLTPDHGKLRLIAKGVRRVKSKLAGGIELFSVSDITFIRGRGDIGTLVSARLRMHYGHIVEDLDRTMLGYELMKELHKITEDEAEAAYFDLLQQSFAALDDPSIVLSLVRLWFSAQLLRLGGHTPNLQTDASGVRLAADQTYHFDPQTMCFVAAADGLCTPALIKFLRLAFSGHSAKVLAQVQGNAPLIAAAAPLVRAMLQDHLRV